MAKDKSQEVFVEPEFNVREFLKGERDRAKATIVVFLLAAALGLASGYLMIFRVWYVGVIVMLFLMVFFKRLLTALHLKVPEVTSHLFFLFMVFFLTWIIFFSVALNPPLNTTSGPELKELQYHFPSTTNFTTVSESNGIYSISVTTVTCDTSFRALISYVTPLSASNMSISLVTSSTPLSSNYVGGWLYFNYTLSSSGTYASYNFVVREIVNHQSHEQYINIKVLRLS